MQIAIAVMTGIALGWIIEWVIDWVYWRRNLPDLFQQVSDLAQRLQATQQELEVSHDKLAGAQAENKRHVTEIGALRTQVADLSDQVAQAKAARNAASPKGRDALEEIKGIGPAYAAHLQGAGIHNLADLAAASAEQLGKTLGSKGLHTRRVGNWIAQARERTQQLDFDQGNGDQDATTHDAT